MRATVLVVEDDDPIRELIVELVAADGFEVWSARNGKEALDVIERAGVPGLVLLDLMMPVMDGWQFLAALRRDAALAAIPVVVVSAVEFPVSGARETLRKPFDRSTLIGAVRRNALLACPDPTPMPLALGL